MAYTIKEAAEIMNVTPTTLRYYDKQGLLPLMERKESGYRIFSENDILMLRVIECLKKSGMSIKEIRQFTEWVLQGDASLQERYHIFAEERCLPKHRGRVSMATTDLVSRKSLSLLLLYSRTVHYNLLTHIIS